MSKINILIVEDNEDHLFFIKKYLLAEQYDLQEIVNGIEAYNYLLSPKVKPDVVLLDNHLPGMSGLEILEKLGAKKEDYGFILTTIDTNPDILVKALKNGVDDLLFKTPEYLYTLPLKIEKAYKYCQSKKAKKETEANFKSIIESGDDDIWAIDTNYKIIAFNKSFKKSILKSYNIKIKIGDDITKIFAKKENDFWKPKYAKVLKGEKLNFKFSPIDDKLILCYDVRLNPIILRGVVTGLSVTGRDITALKKTEYDLLKAHQIANLGSYKLAINSGVWQSSPILDSIFGIDDTYNYNIAGWLNIVHPEDRLMMQNHFMTDVVKNREKFDKEYRIIRIDDKQERWVHGLGELILNDVGEPLQMFGTIQDITESKKAEEKLKQSEQLYKSVFESSPLGIFHFNNKSVITDVNTELVRIIGSTSKKIVGLNIYRDFKDKKLIEAVRCTLEKGLGYYEGDYTSVTANKTTPLVIRFKAIKDVENKIIGGVGLCEDITERKTIEKALKENEHQLQEAQQIAKLGHFIYDDATEIYTTSKILDTIVGVDSSYIKNKQGWTDLCHPEDLMIARRVFNSAKEENVSHEFRMIRFNDKKIIWVFVSARKEFDSNTGQRSKVTGTIQDITERKKAEEKLKQSEQKLLAFQNITNLGTFIFDDSKDVFETGSICNAILGIDATYNRDIQGFINLLHPEDYQEVQELLDNNTIKTIFKELRIVRPKDKKTIWVLSSVSKEFNDKGIRTKITGTIQDITRRKLAEEKLKQSDTILNKLNSLILVNEGESNIIYASPSVKTVLGYEPEEILGQGWWQLTFTDLKSVNNVKQTIREYLYNNSSLPIKISIRKIKTKKGGYKWIEWYVSKGWRNTVIAIGIDITEKYEKERQFKTIIDTANDAVILANHKGNVKEWNPAAMAMFGYSREEILDKPLTKLMPPAYMGAHKKAFADSLKRKKIQNIKTRIVEGLTKKGKRFPIEISFNSWREGNNMVYCAFIKDITEKQREEKVKEVIYNITKKASENNDLSILFNFIRIELSQLIDTTNFFIALYDKKTDLISTPYMVDDKDNSDDFPKGKSLTGYIIDSKKSLIGSRSKFNKLVKEGKITILGPLSKSWVGVPLLAGQEAIGAIVIQSYTEKNAYSQEEVALLELIASNISTAIKQKQDFEAIKQSDIILNKIESSILVGGLGGDIHYISPNIEKLLGYKPAELLGQKWWQMTFFDKGEIKKRQDILDQFILKGIAIKNQFITRKAKTKNGRFKWVEWHISKGVGNTFISIGIDVTEKYRQDNLNNIIYNITKKANEALPKELFFDFIRLQLSKLIDTTNFYIALGNEDSEFLTIPYMIDEKYTRDDFLKKNSLSGYVIDTKNSLLLKNSDKKILKIKEQGSPSSCWLGVPLIIKNRVIGVMVVQSYTDENAYTIEDVRLLELIANSISQVIKQSQDFEQINLLSHALIQSDEGVIITNIKGDIQYVNPAFTKLSAYTEKEVLGQNPRFLKSGEQPLEYYEKLWDTILSGQNWQGEFVNKRKDGTKFLVLANISPIKNEKGVITHFVGVQKDITEKRKLEHDFLHAFIDAQEVEKQSFGEELHDGVSQILSAQTMFVDVLKTLLKNADAKVLKHLNTVKKLNTQAINETRSIAHGLMSKQLKESGLIVAVEHICKDYSTSKDIDFSFNCNGIEEHEITPQVKSNIFRIIQEVSTNTVRHAVAKKAQIKLSKTTNNQLKVVVRDNGIGIDFERMKENKKGAGLENIKRRIKLLNGTIDLKTAPNKGTQYTFRIPLDNIQ